MVRRLQHLGYAVVVPVCSSDSDEPGATAVNVELKTKDEGTNRIETHRYEFTLGEFHRFIVSLRKSVDGALAAF